MENFEWIRGLHEVVVAFKAVQFSGGCALGSLESSGVRGFLFFFSPPQSVVARDTLRYRQSPFAIDR